MTQAAYPYMDNAKRRPTPRF